MTSEMVDLSKILIISDDRRRSVDLVQKLDLSKIAYVHELENKTSSLGSPELIVVDVDMLDSPAILRLRTVLDEVRGSFTQVLFLAHSNPARARTQAGLIGANELMPAAAPSATLKAAIARTWERASTYPSADARKLAADAKQFFDEVLLSGAGITPEIAMTGSELIAHAVAETGVRDWISAVRRFDDATHQHCLLVAGLGAAFADSLGLGRIEGFRLTKSALLHDVGKTKIPRSILNKPGPLSKEEMTVMRTHAVKGFEMLEGCGFSAETLRVVRSHHEMLDGSGYPDGLRGDQIPDIVRLVTICDIFGALIERRPYRPPMPVAEAYTILENMAGRLDADFVKAFKGVTSSME